MKYFLCTITDFIPVPCHAVRWLDPEREFEYALAYWQQYGLELTRERWNTAHTYGYQYAALIDQGQIVSLAAVWRFSDRVWDVAAVSTLETHRRRGYSKRVAAFVTDYILQAGCWASCSIQVDNQAMIATAQSLGFQEVLPEQVLWTYPELPEF